MPITSADLTMVPKTTVELDESGARQLLRLIDSLEDLDDVQEVHANFDIPEAVLEAVAGRCRRRRCLAPVNTGARHLYARERAFGQRPPPPVQ